MTLMLDERPAVVATAPPPRPQPMYRRLVWMTHREGKQVFSFDYNDPAEVHAAQLKFAELSVGYVLYTKVDGEDTVIKNFDEFNPIAAEEILAIPHLVGG